MLFQSGSQDEDFLLFVFFAADFLARDFFATDFGATGLLTVAFLTAFFVPLRAFGLRKAARSWVRLEHGAIVVLDTESLQEMAGSGGEDD